MPGPVIVDAGPLVAFLARAEKHNAWVKEQFRRLRPPLLTCEAVLAEAAHLVRRGGGNPHALLELIKRAKLQVPFRLEEHVATLQALMLRYRDVPMSLADACLVRMAELHSGATVLTLDGDFSIYRKNGRQVIPLIRPGQ